ncbi:MAG: N-acetyltransferase family protein [Burkholderiaceae bacterium]
MLDASTYLVDEILKDSTKVTIRAMRPDDKDRFVKAFHALEPQTLRLRFFYPKRSLTDDDLTRLEKMDYQQRVGLVATVQNAGEEVIIGFGEYVVCGQSAEVAFVVEEDWQGRGVGSRLLQHLTRIALERGVVQFEAEVLEENGPMLAVFRQSALPMATRNGDGTLLVTLSLNALPPSKANSSIQTNVDVR